MNQLTIELPSNISIESVRLLLLIRKQKGVIVEVKPLLNGLAQAINKLVRMMIYSHIGLTQVSYFFMFEVVNSLGSKVQKIWTFDR